MSGQPVEITITFVHEDKRCKEKFLVYEEVSLKYDDPVLMSCIDKIKESFKAPPEKIIVKASTAFV